MSDVRDAEMEEKFLQFICDEYRTLGPRPNRKAAAIFRAIQDSFDGTNMGGPVVVDPYLIHNLSACALIALSYDKSEHISWDKSDHDYILNRTLRGFMYTLVGCIREGRYQVRGDETFVEGFKLPDWFVRWALIWSWTPASIKEVKSAH